VGDDEYAVDFEVMEEAETSDKYQAAAKPLFFIPPAPVHPLSSLVTIVLDLLWKGAEAGATLSVVAAPGVPLLILVSGATCFASVTIIQRYVDHDSWGTAIAKASAMGIVAGVPFFVTGTVVGGVLLGWAGVHSVESLVHRQLPSPPK
jgi:hypothetical protein